MNRVDINLGRTLMLKPATRCVLCRMIRLHLVVMAALLGLSLFFAYTSGVKAAHGYRDLASRRQQFQLKHPGVRSMQDYADGLRGEIVRYTALAGTVRDALPDTVHTTLPLLEMMTNLPDGTRLQRLSMRQGGRRPASLEFSILVDSAGGAAAEQVARQAGSLFPDPERHYASITPVRTSMERMGNRDVYLITYRVALRGR